MSKSPRSASSSADVRADNVAQSIPERFEDAVSELEAIVAAMESGQLSLEDSLTHFQRGTLLLRHCRGALESAEERIRILQDGELQAFDDPDKA